MFIKLYNMKILFFSLFLLITMKVNAQPTAMSASKGVYLSLGNEFANNFTYVIARKSATEKVWKELAQTSFPNSSAALKARIMSAPSILLRGKTLSDTVVKVIWRRANGALYTDSIKPYHEIPLYTIALGIGYLDTTAVPGTYQYRIYKRNADEVNTDSTTLNFTHLPASLKGSLTPFYYQAADEAVSISYQYNGVEKLGGVRVLRSRFGYNQFETVPAFTIFSKKGDTAVASITDQTAAYKVAYQYIAIPFDELGNYGQKSDTLYIYNNSRSYDIGFFKSINADAVDKESAIKLSWKLSSPSDVTAIKIFKSLSWDGKYIEVSSASANDTVWYDKKVQPMITYYYRLQAQGPYSSSIASNRIQALMKTPRKNIFPPNELTATTQGNVVTLKFNKMANDTRGYYVYKKEGYSGKAVQLPRVLLSKDSALTYQDTLKNLNKSAIYTYTVAAINTSYEISPQSDAATVMLSGRIPIASKVSAQLSNNRAIVFWNDVRNENLISGYNVYRVKKDQNVDAYGEKELLAELSPQSNSYLDSTLVEGNHYGYYIQCKGIANNGEDLGSLSPIATVHYNSNKIFPPADISAIPQSNSIALSWTNPLGITAAKVRIYRGKVDEPLVLLKELSGTETSFEDKAISAETTYFYTLSLLDTKGKESKQTEPLGVRSR
jgi:hypothetical protein